VATALLVAASFNSGFWECERNSDIHRELLLLKIIVETLGPSPIFNMLVSASTKKYTTHFSLFQKV
jgi:hypothetical protein